MQTTEQLTEQEHIVLAVAGNPDYQTKTGRTRWSAAAKDHPQYRDVLLYPNGDANKAIHVLSRLAERGIQPNQSRIRQNTRPLSLKQQTVYDLYQKFKLPGGKMDWKAAFAAHPEAVPIITTKKSGNVIAHQILVKLRDRGVIPQVHQRKYKKRAAANGTLEREPAKTTDQIEAEQQAKFDREVNKRVALVVEYMINDNKVCPRCLKNLEHNLRGSFMETKALVRP